MRNKIIRILIATQLIILPFLDMIRTTSFRHFEILGISAIELCNIILIGMAFLLTIIKIFKDKKLHVFGVFVFLGLSVIYMYFHYQNLMHFNTSLMPKTDFNFMRECFYICRVYILPLMLLFVLLENRDIFNKNFYFKIIKIVIAIISFSIIFLDIFKISYISYSAKHDFVAYNMFDYFLYNGNYKLLSARGWFDSANELSAITLMLLPLNIYMLYKEKNKFNYLLFIVQVIAMILLGTRTSALGAVMISIVSLIGYLFLSFIKKEDLDKKLIKYYAVITLCCSAYMCISPFMFGRINDSNHDFSIQNDGAYNDLKNADEKDYDKLIKKYASEYLINEIYFKYYPIQNDKEFWLKIAARNKALNSNDRNLKVEIISRIKEKNSNKMDTYLGMGYTLGFLDLERDYVYQYYIFGIFGVILFILPYLLLFGYNLIMVMLKLKKNLKFVTLVTLMSSFLGLVIAYLSGHVFGWVSPMMFLVMVLSLLSFIIKENSLESSEIDER